MTTCAVTGLACDCQPDEGIACTATPENVVKAMHGWRTACLKAEAELQAQSQPAPPVPEDGPMMVRGTNANGTQWMGTMRQVMEDYKQAAEIEAREADRLRQRIAELESPTVPSSVQEIMRLMMPYVRACITASVNAVVGMADADEQAKFDATLKPLQAALTALVDDNHRLRFELAGVRAMRGPMEWVSVDECLPNSGVCVLGAILHRYTNAPDEYAITMMAYNGYDWGDYYAPTHWMPLPPPPTTGIAPEQGEVK